MIRAVAYSKSRAFACAAGVGALLAVCAVRHHVASLRSSWLRLTAGKEGALCAEIAGLGAYESPCLENLRRQVRGFRTNLGAPDTWERLAGLLGKAWTTEPGRREDRDGYSVSVGTVALTAPATSDWPQIVDAVRAVEQVPGVGVVGFEMRTSGDREHRVVDLVKVIVSTQTQRPPQETLIQ